MSKKPQHDRCPSCHCDEGDYHLPHCAVIVAQHRRAALEEAARLCVDYADKQTISARQDTARNLAQRIRALASAAQEGEKA